MSDPIIVTDGAGTILVRGDRIVRACGDRHVIGDVSSCPNKAYIQNDYGVFIAAVPLVDGVAVLPGVRLDASMWEVQPPLFEWAWF